MIQIIFLINIYFQMSTIFCIFLLFYSINVMEAKPQGIEAGEPDLEAVFKLEDELEASPFLLESGERYRDLLTITAARNVGQFGVIRFQEDFAKSSRLAKPVQQLPRLTRD